MTINRRGLLAASLALPCATSAARAQTAAWPQRPVTIVVGYTAGGAGDVMGRLVAQLLGDELKQSVVVENRPGASSTIAAASVARAAPDGYTLLLATAPDSVIWPLVKQLPYNVERDFTPICLLCTVPSVLVVPVESPFKSVDDLATFAKQNPGKLNYGAFGVGSSAHMAAELFQNATGTKMTYTPYQGSSRAVVDLLTGRIDLMFDTFASAWPHVQAGKLRALAVTTGTRVPTAPDIPTMQQAGLPGFVSQAFIGITAPAGLPADILQTLESATQTIVATPGFRTRLQDLGMVFAGFGTKEYRGFLKGETERNRKLITDAKIVLE